MTELWVGGSYSIATLLFLRSMVVPRLCCFLHARQLSPPESLVQPRTLCMCLSLYPAALLSTRRRRGPRQQPPLVRKSPLPKPDSAHALSCWIWLVNYWHLHLHNCNSRSGLPHALACAPVLAHGEWCEYGRPHACGFPVRALSAAVQWSEVEAPLGVVPPPLTERLVAKVAKIALTPVRWLPAPSGVALRAGLWR